MRENFLRQKNDKNAVLKKHIIRLCIDKGSYNIADLSRLLGTSVPTVTKLVMALIDEGFLVDLGKQDTSGGRRPSIYGLNPEAGFFIGVRIGRRHANICITDFKGEIVAFEDEIPFTMEPKVEAVHRVAEQLRHFVLSSGIPWRDLLGGGVSFTGRVNPFTGYSNLFSGPDQTDLGRILEEDLGIPVVIENDSRAMTYGEYVCGSAGGKENMLFVNVNWGLGMGIIVNGHLYYGKSGYSGEFGHFPMLDNDKICSCGKVGCLETGASGSALHRMVLERLEAGRASSLTTEYRKRGTVSLEEILRAVGEEDVLAIQCVEEVGALLGRAISGLINVFNPEIVVLGGKVAKNNEYLMLSINSSIRKYAQNFVAKDTTIVFSELGRKAAPVGAALLSRARILGI